MDAVDALIAGFPAGTVSGAPKIRAMELIDEQAVVGALTLVLLAVFQSPAI